MGLLPPVVATLLADNKQFNAGMAESDAAMKKFGDTATATGAKADAFASKLSTGILVAGAVVAGASIKLAGSFQLAMTQLVTGAGEAQANIKMVSKGILDMAGIVGQTPQQLAAGMYLIESAGFHGAAGLKVLKASAEGAAVGGAQMATVANAVTTAMHDYHIPVQNANAVTSALVQTVAMGKTHLEDLAGSIGKVMPVASALGINFQTVTGAMATMTNAGLSARFAAMHLNNTLLAISSPSKVAIKAMGSVGITAQGLKDMIANPSIGLAGGIKYVTDMIGQKFPAGSIQAVQAFKDIMGGATGLSTALMLGGKNSATFAADVQGIGKVLGSTAPQVQGFSKVQKDFNFQLEQLKSKGAAFGIQLGDWLLPKVSSVATWALGVTKYLQSHPATVKVGMDFAGALLAGSAAVKLTEIGAKIASGFGIAISEGVAATAGAAIGAAVLAVLLTGNGNQAVTGVKQLGKHHYMSGAENILGAVDNTLRGALNFLTPGIHLGSILQPKKYGTAGNPGETRGEVYGPTRPGGTSHWHVRVTR